MSPVDIAAPFSTVVSLIGLFKSGRDAAQGQDYMEFMAWLVETGHKELKDLIEANHTTTIGIKAVLSQQNDQLVSTLARIDTVLASFSSAIEGFSSVSEGLQPGSRLSPQALSILRQFSLAKASTALERKVRGGQMLYLIDGKNGYIEAADLQFLEDDLQRLVELGLLRSDFNSKGERLFRFTRAGNDLAQGDNP